jgi:hypothetical protein
MTGLVRKATLLGVCGLFLAAAASANVPDPSKSSVPGFLRVGGAQTNAGVPDPTITYTVTVRDFANNPIAGSFVEANFTNCTDTKLCSAVVAGQTVDCTNKAVRARRLHEPWNVGAPGDLPGSWRWLRACVCRRYPARHRNLG